MKCESCGNELIGAAIICRACNHNNALHRRIAWRRIEPSHDQSTPPRASGPPAEFPTIVPRKDADVNLLHFPSASNRQPDDTPAQQTVAESGSKTETYPPWRAELKERVRRIKEKRATSGQAAPAPSPVQSPRAQAGEANPGRNPIVESALNRIRRTPHATHARGDEATGRRGDFSQRRPVAPSPNRPVAQSPNRPAAPSPRRPVSPSLPPPVPSSQASPQISAGEPSVSGPPTGAPDNHVETLAPEIAQALEPPRSEAEPALLYARLLAGVCDFEIVLTAFLLIFGSYATSNNAASFGDESRFLTALLLLAVAFIYQIVMLAFAGRTFGMALLNLNVVNTGDENLPVTLWRKMLRASAATIVFICFPLYLTAWLNVSRRTLPDLISGTTVAQQ
ncbi:MAG TPA: RDD family protein [Blastocatellia bacterium]|nr:RDD family protein [Blastocatellia bacterium]